MLPPPPALLDFYRAEAPEFQGKLLRAGLAIAAGATTTLVGSLSLFYGVPSGFKPVFAVLGAAILLYGLICGFVSLPRLLAHDAFVGVRRDALMVSSGTGPALVFPWDDIARIAHAEERLVVHLRDGAPHVIDQKFGPIPVSHIAQKLEYLRRKAAMNLL